MTTVGNLLDGRAFRVALESAIRSAERRITMYSAYVTSSGMNWFSQLVPNNIEVGIVARWRPMDLLSGASDLKSFEVARKFNWDFRVNKFLHAKLWLIDEHILFVGSGNTTARGLALIQDSNIEFGTKICPVEADLKMLRALFDNSIKITPELFNEMSIALLNLKLNGVESFSVQWPEKLREKLQPKYSIESLWISDFFLTDGVWLKTALPSDLSSDALHDSSLLGVDIDIGSIELSRPALVQLLEESVPFRWLRDVLMSEPSHEAYFGNLSVRLHTSLADDPRPRRQEVKVLLANLLSWIEVLAVAGIQIDRPNYSQRVRLVESLS